MYDKEGNRLDLGLVSGYSLACRFVQLPMRRYVLGVLTKLDRDKRELVIYDQLNPQYAKYYTRGEAEQLSSLAGSSWHRHGYSWTVVGERSADARGMSSPRRVASADGRTEDAG